MKLKATLTIILVFAGLAFGQTACATYGIDYQHTGQSPYVGPHEGVRLLWYIDNWLGDGEMTMDSEGNFYNSSPYHIYKYNINGVLLNEYIRPVYMANCYPVLSPDEEYLLSSETLITTDFMWVTQLDKNSEIYSTYSGFTSNGLPILVGKSGNNLITIVYDIAGTEIWRYQIDDYNRRRYPLITHSNNIIFGNTYQYAESGSYMWFYDMDGNRTIDEDNNVYIFYSNRVCLDKDGKEVWVIDNAEGIYYPSWHPDGFLLCNGNALYAFDPADGSILWGPVLEDHSQDSNEKPIIDTEGYIYTTESGVFDDLVCLDSSGTEVWREEVEIPISGNPEWGPFDHTIIAPNGNLYYVGGTSEDGRFMICLTESGAWVNDTNFAARVNDDGSVSLSWTDSPEWPFHSYIVDRVIKEDRYAGVHPITEQPIPADGGPYELLDTDLEPGQTWEYTLKAIRGDGITHPYGPIEIFWPGNEGVSPFLAVPYPNPANSAVTLEYELPSSTTTASITVYDLSGRRITTQTLDPTSGRNSLTLPTDSYPPGVYLAHLDTNTAGDTRRFVISR